MIATSRRGVDNFPRVASPAITFMEKKWGIRIYFNASARDAIVRGRKFVEIYLDKEKLRIGFRFFMTNRTKGGEIAQELIPLTHTALNAIMMDVPRGVWEALDCQEIRKSQLLVRENPTEKMAFVELTPRCFKFPH